MKKRILFLTAILLMALVVAACVTGRSGYQSAPYKVSHHEGDFEVRDYPVLQLASTRLSGEDKSFMRLFNYISGQNDAKEKIAMTTPVFMNGNEMSFVMPESLKQAVPRPTAGEVEIKSMPARRVASYRFRGSRSAASEKEAVKRLEEWLVKNKLTASGAPFFAYYDPPWTPGPWRRNEALVPLKEQTR